MIVVMGVSGCGKTTVGKLLAERLGSPFLEGDELHPPANVAKMREGTPLTDDDRWGWLREIAGWMREHDDGVVTCSALKHAYRDVLREGDPEVYFVHLAADKETLAARVAERSHAFMPASLLDSQFADLEPLGPDERGATVDATMDPSALVELVRGGFTE